MCIKYVFTYSLMIKNHRKREVINHWKLLLLFTCCFTPVAHTYDYSVRNCNNFNEDNPDDFFVDLKKKLTDIKDHGNTAFNDRCNRRHTCYEREIYGILASVVGNASFPHTDPHYSSQLISFWLRRTVCRTKVFSHYGIKKT